jgi:hypothetical protein
MKKAYLFDVEGDGLQATKIWCVSYISLNDHPHQVKTITGQIRIKKFFLQKDVTFYGHNIWLWDIPTIERVYDIKIEAKIQDTLGWSWYFFGGRPTHGLEAWGKDLGVKKVEVEDKEWEGPLEGETQEDFIAKMTHRCEEDVKINLGIIKVCRNKAARLYGKEANLTPLYDYLSEKQRAYYIKLKNPFNLDLELCEEGLGDLEQKFSLAHRKLEEILPDVPVYVTKTFPKKPHKKDGSLSASGISWFALLKKEGLPENHSREVKCIRSYVPPNANSSEQVKDYLFSLGWEPTVYKDSVSKKTGSVNSVPQLRVDDGKGSKTLPDCIKEIADTHPQLWVLEDMGVLSHRISILKGFMSAQESGKITADMAGFTNTLRVRHRTLVNLPGVDKEYGELIRGCLAAPDGYELVGCDVSGLEDTTKRHYIYKYDPKYVEEQMHPDFDAHVDIAILANLMTEEEANWFKACDRYFESLGEKSTPRQVDVQVLRESDTPEDDWGIRKSKLKKVRHLAKITNFSSTYGIGYKKLAKQLKISDSKAKKIIAAYWDRNWAIKEFVKKELNQTVITTKERYGGKFVKEMWVRSPINGFFYPVRSEKDLFSAVNQSTGAFLFDQWVKIIVDKYPKLAAQFHDEIVLIIPKGYRERISNWLTECMNEVNEKYKLNTPLRVKAEFGPNYSEIH